MTKWQRWRARNPEKWLASNRAAGKRWRAKHPEKVREYNARQYLNRKRRVLRRALGGAA